MKQEGLIKINNDVSDNLYYDSNTKRYISIMHCPHCGKHTGYWCYLDFDSIPLFNSDFPNKHCSDRCFVLDSIPKLWEIAIELGIEIKPNMEEWNASKIVRVYTEDLDYDALDLSGEPCEI